MNRYQFDEVFASLVREYLNPPDVWLQCDPRTRMRFFVRKTIGMVVALPVLLLAIPFLLVGLPLALIGTRLMWCANWLAMDFDIPKPESK